jgi:threonine dehydrogenase-like Zn-dependent dehydrogenase
VESIASGEVKTAPLFSKHFSLDEYLAAYQFIENQGEKSMKVFIDVS